MNLEHLRTFACVAELGSFTKAAESLGLTQPSISRIVRELEHAWHGTLFKRTGRGVELSALGEEALKRVRALLRNADQISDDMRSLGQLPGGRVTLALPPSLIGSVPPELVSRLSSKYPAIRLRLYEGFSDQIQRWLADRVVDIGVYSQFCVEGEPTLTSQPDLLLAAKTRLVLAGFAGSHRLPAEIDFERLAEFPLVLPVPTNSLRVVVDSVARKMSLTLTILAEAESQVAQEALARKCGYYMLRGETTPTKGRDFRLSCSAVKNPCIERHTVLSVGNGRQISPATRAVASMVVEFVGKANC